jgi:hypothetical protein
MAWPWSLAPFGATLQFAPREWHECAVPVKAITIRPDAQEIELAVSRTVGISVLPNTAIVLLKLR